MRAGITPQPIIHTETEPLAKVSTGKKKVQPIVIVTIIVILLIAVGLLIYPKRLRNGLYSNLGKSPTPMNNTTGTPMPTSSTNLKWGFNGEVWQANGTPPACPTEILSISPVDFNLATGILYPGQYRGGDFKAHGGVRFDNNKDTKITVLLPFDGQLIRGSQYIESGEVQYIMDFVNPCGIMIRFDHLKVLTPTFAEIFKTLPPAKVDDSRTTEFNIATTYIAGTVIATEVGHNLPTLNVGVDFGVYDLRQRNTAANSANFVKEHQRTIHTAGYALCWLDYLPGNDKARVKALPGADQKNKKISEYCK